MTTIWQNDLRGSNRSDQCFVLMPFGAKWSDRIWTTQIRPIVSACGMPCLRADDLYGNNVMEDVARGIRESRIVIADITDRNPNVFYELGAAHALGKSVILLAQNENDIPFDIRGHRCILYEDNADGYEILRSELPKFIDEFLYAGLVDNYGDIIGQDEFVVLFLSYGGTCRCAMANAVTRDKLRQSKCGEAIHPISAGLISTTYPYASEEAKMVVSEHLSMSLDNHKTLKADFALLRRADLILPMDKRMKDSVPLQYADKTILFTEMFGSRGDVADPYEKGHSAYSESFQLIGSLIGANIGRLCSLAGKKKT